MWQLIGLIVLVFIFVKCKKGLVKLWGSLDSDTKLVIVEKPTHYRNYNQYIHLSEVIHWDVVPAMGESHHLIKQGIDGALELIIGSDGYTPEVTLSELADRWEQVGKNYKNYDLFLVFFRLLAKKSPTTQYQLRLVVGFINTAV